MILQISKKWRWHKSIVKTISFWIQIRIVLLWILPCLSIANSTRRKLTLSQIVPNLDLNKQNSQNFTSNAGKDIKFYMHSSSLFNEFFINSKSNNKDNNTFAIMDELFMNIRQKLL